MEKIIEDKKIDECTKQEKKQIMNYTFGNEFMASKNKGQKVNY